jgi:hypothetical protein
MRAKHRKKEGSGFHAEAAGTNALLYLATAPNGPGCTGSNDTQSWGRKEGKQMLIGEKGTVAVVAVSVEDVPPPRHDLAAPNRHLALQPSRRLTCRLASV